MTHWRYNESREQSAELLRMALARMGRHPGRFNPITFTLWYEHVAQTNPPLSAEIDRMELEARPVDDAAVESLYRRHVAPIDAQAMERIGQQLQGLMGGLASTAADAGQRAGSFGAQLGGLSSALVSRDLQQLAEQVRGTLAGIGELIRSAEALGRTAHHGQDEIASLRRELARARVEVLIDPLTGILNRKGFDQRLAALLAMPRGDGTPHCLVLFDIDHFKHVNDTHGHVVGDQVLRGVGAVLRHALTDPLHAVARYGGEEFALLAPRTAPDEAARLAEHMRAGVKAMRLRSRATKEARVAVTVSAGLTTARVGDDAAGLVARADAALYRAKQGGRDRLALDA